MVPLFVWAALVYYDDRDGKSPVNMLIKTEDAYRT